MKLPEDELRRAVATASGGGRSAEAEAKVRMAVSAIPGAGALAERRVVRDLLASAEPFPLGDDWAIEDWRYVMTERAVVAAASQESPTWDVTRIVDQVEALARRRAEVDERGRLEAEARAEQERQAAEIARQRQESQERVVTRRWLTVAQGFGFDVADVQVMFDDDLEHAERVLAVQHAEQAAQEESTRRRRRSRLLAIGVGLGACVVAGRACRSEGEQFALGVGLGAGVAAWAVAGAFADTLVDDAGHVAKGAALVTSLGRLA